MFENLRGKRGGGGWIRRRSRQGMVEFSKIPEKGLSVGTENGPSLPSWASQWGGGDPGSGDRGLWMAPLKPWTRSSGQWEAFDGSSLGEAVM